MTTWAPARSKRCAPKASPARCRSSASTASRRRSTRCAPASSPAPSPRIRSGRAAWGWRIGYNAKIGKFDPTKEPPEHREFYGKAVLISKDNVEEYYKTNIDSKPEIDWNDLWGRVTGPIRA